MSIRNLDEKESRYGEVYIRLLQKQLGRTDGYKKEFLENKIPSITKLESFVNYLKNATVSKRIYEKILKNTADNVGIIGKAKYASRRGDINNNILDTDTFFIKPFDECIKMFKYREKAYTSLEIVTYLLTIVYNQKELEVLDQEDSFDGFYYVLMDLLNNIKNKLTNINFCLRYEPYKYIHGLIHNIIKFKSILLKMIGNKEYNELKNLLDFYKINDSFDYNKIKKDIADRYSIPLPSEEAISYIEEISSIAIKQYSEKPIDVKKYKSLLIREIILEKVLEGFTEISSLLSDINIESKKNQKDIDELVLLINSSIDRIKITLLKTIRERLRIESVAKIIENNSYTEAIAGAGEDNSSFLRGRIKL